MAEPLQVEKLVTLLNEIVRLQFYGELVVKFEEGRIIYCKKTETIKL